MSDAETVRTDDGVGLSVERFGVGDRFLLVPSTANAADFGALVPDGGHAGSDAGDSALTIVCYDARGRGSSDAMADGGRLGLHADVEDLEAVRRHLGAETVSVLGTAYYAGAAAHYAAAHPDRVDRVVLAAPLTVTAQRTPRPATAPAPHLLARLDQLEADGLAERDPVAFCREWRAVYIPQLLAEPEAYERFRADPCAHPNEWPRRVARTMAHLFLGLGEWDWRDVARAVLAPTLVVYGEQDSITPGEMAEWADVLPVGRLWVVPRAARFPWVERRGLFADALWSFLQGRWPDGAV